MKLLKYIVLIGAVCAAFTLQPAKADVFTSSLDFANSDLAPFGPGPFGTVTVSLASGSFTATITFSAASGFEFVDTSAAAVEINSTDFTPVAGSISPNTLSPTFGSGQVDGFGNFNLTVDYANASIGFTTISFMVTDNTDTWLSAADVLGLSTGGNGGFDAAAHMRATENNPQGLTGFAGETGGGIVTPDSGTTAMLLGLGLSGLGLVRRFVKR
jgi:hypothetical protein